MGRQGGRPTREPGQEDGARPGARAPGVREDAGRRRREGWLRRAFLSPFPPSDMWCDMAASCHPGEAGATPSRCIGAACSNARGGACLPLAQGLRRRSERQGGPRAPAPPLPNASPANNSNRPPGVGSCLYSPPPASSPISPPERAPPRRRRRKRPPCGPHARVELLRKFLPCRPSDCWALGHRVSWLAHEHKSSHPHAPPSLPPALAPMSRRRRTCVALGLGRSGVVSVAPGGSDAERVKAGAGGWVLVGVWGSEAEEGKKREAPHSS